MAHVAVVMCHVMWHVMSCGMMKGISNQLFIITFEQTFFLCTDLSSLLCLCLSPELFLPSDLLHMYEAFSLCYFDTTYDS